MLARIRSYLQPMWTAVKPDARFWQGATYGLALITLALIVAFVGSVAVGSWAIPTFIILTSLLSFTPAKHACWKAGMPNRVRLSSRAMTSRWSISRRPTPSLIPANWLKLALSLTAASVAWLCWTRLVFDRSMSNQRDRLRASR
jgi:hypothetical protein